jgi:hypothetical protein
MAICRKTVAIVSSRFSASNARREGGEESSVGTLAILLLIAALAGLLAAQLPARRAARLDVLGALASE